MVKQTHYATREFKYGTRMLTAGDPVEMTGPVGRVFRALGDVTLDKPRKPVKEVVPAITAEPTEPKAPKAGAKARAKKATAKK